MEIFRLCVLRIEVKEVVVIFLFREEIIFFVIKIYFVIDLLVNGEWKKCM